MNKTAAALPALALLVMIASGTAAAGAATPGYAVYQVQVSSLGLSHSLTINETVAGTSDPAKDNLILHLVSGNLSVAYSRTINSSDTISPFLPAITNQSFSASYNGSTVSASVAKAGASQVQFQGASRTLATYALSASATVNGTTSSAAGTIETFQSGLVYMVNLTATVPLSGLSIPGQLGAGLLPLAAIQVNVMVTLLSTSLPLTVGSPSGAAQAASAGIGLGVAASAVAVGLGVRRHNRRSEPAPEVKPEHWVD